MRLLIVEDETAAYENLVSMLQEIDPGIQVAGNTESIRQTLTWLGSNPAPDLILMDIHLSDGSAFTIFRHLEVETPVIFTTAYDEYAIEAFKVNSVDYLLKPVKREDLSRSLDKFNKLNRQDILHYLANVAGLVPTVSYPDKILIPDRDHILPVGVNDISFFYSTEKATRVYLKDGRNYPYAKTLEQIVAGLNPLDFVRANKQFVIARHSVRNITVWFDSRLLLTLDTEPPERVYVSKNKAAEFKNWMVREK